MAIKKLDPIVASRIAAGEVVERPASVLRELLDNSIDANADSISVYIEQGGTSLLTVKDNGKGMSAADLEIACESHATSKVETIDDLYSLKTLGFRGEALCSISACSKLTISSNGHTVVCDNGVQGKVMKGSVEKGTVITMENLFEHIPARKQFLKRDSSEANECRKIFIEKALGFENIEFFFFNNNELELHYEKADKQKRVIDVLSENKDFVKADSTTMETKALPIELFAVCSTPALYRRDRGQIKIFVNNRAIDNYTLVQAVTNAYSVALPGGAFPYFYLFIQNSPSLIDFNIHPTKRECKMRNQSEIYAVLTKMIRTKLLNLKRNEAEEISSVSQSNLFEAKPEFKPSFSVSAGNTAKHYEVSEKAKLDPSWFESAKKVMGKTANTEILKSNVKEPEYKYLGQLFNTFLVVETKDKVLFIDQHAAHERILYDNIKENPDKQSLMIPFQFETNRSCDDFLLENSVIYQELGIEIVRVKPMLWELVTVPAICRNEERKIADYIQNASGDVIEIQKGIFAIIACHSAIKAGDVLDAITAENLLEKVFSLDAMLCPHGRSFVYSILKEQLFREVGRTV